MSNSNDPVSTPVTSASTGSPMDYASGFATSGPAYTGGAPSEEDKSTASLMFYLSIILGFISPLIFMFTKKDRPFVQDQSKELLNFQLVLLVVYIVLGVLGAILGRVAAPLALVGTLLTLAVWVVNLLLMIKAAGKAKTGVPARLPSPIRVIK